MKLQCPECGASVPAENVNMQQMMAMCPQCDNAFEFGPAGPLKSKSGLRRPQNIRIEESNDHLTLSFRHISYEAQQVLVFSVIGTVGIPLGLFLLLVESDGKLPPIIVMLGVFLFLIFLYALRAMVLNTTTVVVDRNHLRIEQGPVRFLPMGVNPGVYATSQIEALQWLTYVDTRRNSWSLRPSYYIVADMRNGREVVLFRSMSRMHARYITKKLERFIDSSAETYKKAKR